MILFQNQLLKREEAKIDVEDRGYQFGDGIYEVIRVYHGEFFDMETHMERLVRSATEIHIAIPFSIEEISRCLKALIKENELKDGIVYMQITRGAAVRTHHFPEHADAVLIAYTKEMVRPLDLILHGIHAVLTEDIRWLRCDIKSLNLLANVLAKQEAKDHGVAEAIFHRDNVVTEASSSNVFIVREGGLLSHPANHLILNGVTRGQVFQLADHLGIPAVRRPFTIDELYHADEVFISSTTMEVTPVVQINETKINEGTVGPVTRKLQHAFEQLIPVDHLAEVKTNQ